MDTCYLSLPGKRVVTFDYPPKFHLPRYLKAHGIQNYEPISQAYFLASVESRDGAVFDIGANIGVYSMVVANLLRRPVYAYEPFSEAADVLKKIAAQFSFPIHVTEAAVSKSMEDQNFYLSAKSDMSNSLNEGFREHREIRTVKSVSIDSQAAMVRPCAIKIDTETTEMDVLESGAETIKRDRPAMLVEILNDALADEVTAFIEPFDYTIFRLGDAEVAANLGGVDDLDIGGDTRNWLLLPKEHADLDALTARARHWLSELRQVPLPEPE